MNVFKIFVHHSVVELPTDVFTLLEDKDLSVKLIETMLRHKHKHELKAKRSFYTGMTFGMIFMLEIVMMGRVFHLW